MKLDPVACGAILAGEFGATSFFIAYEDHVRQPGSVGGKRTSDYARVVTLA